MSFPAPHNLKQRRQHDGRIGITVVVAVVSGLFVVGLFVRAASPSTEQVETFTIYGIERQAIVYPNAKPAPGAGAPVVFVFHGHGGTAQNVARRLRIHELWPEAVVAYLQGVPGVQGITDPEGKRNGWQKSPGEVGDRDIKFFDAALERMQKKYRTDPTAYMCWATRTAGDL
jgi:polyhydroxybutyrate depolymerase